MCFLPISWNSTSKVNKALSKIGLFSNLQVRCLSSDISLWQSEVRTVHWSMVGVGRAKMRSKPPKSSHSLVSNSSAWWLERWIYVPAHESTSGTVSMKINSIQSIGILKRDIANLFLIMLCKYLFDFKVSLMPFQCFLPQGTHPQLLLLRYHLTLKKNPVHLFP